MKKLKNPIPAVHLRKFTHLRATCNNVTRWSSSANMFVRYPNIKEFLPQLAIDDLDDLLLTARKNKSIDTICDDLMKLDSVTKE